MRCAATATVAAASVAATLSATPTSCLKLELDDASAEELRQNLLLALISGKAAVCKVTPQGKPCPHASGPEQPVQGFISLIMLPDDTCEIAYRITGLTPGEHGFHIQCADGIPTRVSSAVHC